MSARLPHRNLPPIFFFSWPSLSYFFFSLIVKHFLSFACYAFALMNKSAPHVPSLTPAYVPFPAGSFLFPIAGLFGLFVSHFENEHRDALLLFRGGGLAQTKVGGRKQGYWFTQMKSEEAKDVFLNMTNGWKSKATWCGAEEKRPTKGGRNNNLSTTQIV